MRALIAGFLAIFSAPAFAAEWRDQDDPAKKTKSVVIESKDGIFGRSCQEEQTAKVSEYVFDVYKSGMCSDNTMVTLTIDETKKSYQFECFGRDSGGVLLALTGNMRNEQSFDDIEEITDRIQKAKNRSMSITTNITKRALSFPLNGAKEKLEQIVKFCQQ